MPETPYRMFLFYTSRSEEAVSDGGAYLRLADRYGGTRDDVENAIECFEAAIRNIQKLIEYCKGSDNA